MIEAKHGEHKIQYDEDSNTWHCRAMKCSAPSLAALRTRLNAEDREDRRVSDIRAFSLDRAYGGPATEVIITMIDTNRHGVNGYRADRQSIKKREYFSLHSLVIINEKSLPKIERYKKAADAVEAADKELQAARDALPKTTIEELKKLSERKLNAA